VSDIVTSMSGIRSTLNGLSIPLRFAVVGAALLGLVGGVVGLVVGLRTYVPTAWAAVFEIGIPAAALGAVLGLAAGSVAVAARRRHRPLDG
jgi:hypothetical protein